MKASRLLPALAALLLAGQRGIEAQILPLTVPKGVFRLDFSGRLEAYDWRWRDGSREEAAADFNRPSLDGTFSPILADAEARLARITGLSDVRLSLGQGIASKYVHLGTTGIGAAFGLTKWLTLSGNVPIVQVKVEPRFLLGGGGNAGLNLGDPVLGSGAAQAQTTAFVSGLAAAIDALDTRISRGDYDADPARKAAAQSALAQARAISVDLVPLLTQTGPFLPVTDSPIGAALVQTLTSLSAAMTAFDGVDGFGLPFLPTSPVTGETLNSVVTNPDGPIAALPFDDTPAFSYLGDIELGATVALLNRFPASRFGSGIRTYLQTTVRLRTAQLDNPNRFFDVGSGDRQPDVEVSLVTDLAAGRFGTRLSGGYNLQLPGNQNRRVARFDQPLAPITTLAGVRRDPGDVLMLGAKPFFRLATYLSLFGGVEYWSKQRDVFTYAQGQPPIEGVDIDVLGDGTRSDALLLSGGLTYSHSGLDKRGILKLPMDASFRYQRIARSGNGIVPDLSSMAIDFRLYTRLFGRN